jgi:hypothetical protein
MTIFFLPLSWDLGSVRMKSPHLYAHMRNWKTLNPMLGLLLCTCPIRKIVSLCFFCFGTLWRTFTLKEVENYGRIIIQGLKIANFSKLGLCPHNSTPAISLGQKQ